LRSNERPLLAVTDERKFRHVVLNILVNAVKYTREGSVMVSTRADGGYAVIEIVDTGIGISPELLPRVFEEFMQAEGADMRQGGVGLGLAIAKRCAELIGGSIRVESSVGKGSAFTFRVPLGASAARPPETDVRERRDRSFGRRAMDLRPAGDADAQNDGRKTILVIDDDPDGRLSAAALLGDSFDIRSSSNGVEGVMLAGAFSPDLILLDLTMPGLSGIQTVELLRASPKTEKIPVIAVSASVVDPATLIASGFDAYIPKPIDGERLLEEIKGFL
jgi:CheY-like chemotaxis protein/anti-sigma regulatory factor (Ser/Thr protein kinase)